MSAFNAKICIKDQLLLWFLLWFGEGFEMLVAALVSSLIVRWQRHRPVYLSQTSIEWNAWKACRRRTESGQRTVRRLRLYPQASIDWNVWKTCRRWIEPGQRTVRQLWLYPRARNRLECSEEKTCRRYACRKRRASPVEGAFGESAVKLLASALIPS